MAAKAYIHAELDEEIRAIGGYYRFTREWIIPLEGEDVLCLIGYALLDTSCCGAAGCGYALCEGVIEAYHTGKMPDGRWISRLRPLDDPLKQRRVKEIIRNSECIDQVIFA